MIEPITSARVEHAARRMYRHGFEWSNLQPPLQWNGWLLWFLVHGNATWFYKGNHYQISGCCCGFLPVDQGPLSVRCDANTSQSVYWFHVVADEPLNLPLFSSMEVADNEGLLQQCLISFGKNNDECLSCMQTFLYRLRRQGQSEQRKKLDEFDLLCGHIRKHPGDEWSIDVIASKLNISERSVYARFQKRHNCSPHAFVNKERISLAQELLRHSDQSIKQIAAACGFSDQFAFSNSFLRACNIRPSAYRRKHSRTI